MNAMMRNVPICLAAFLTLACAAEDDGFVIGPRKSRIWFASSLNDSQFHAEAAEAARLLAADKLESAARAELTEGLRRDRPHTARAFAAFLDPRKTSDARVRLGAIAALKDADPAPADAGKLLAAAAIMEPDATVRTAALNLIRERKDVVAAQEIVRAWHRAFEDEALGVDEALRTATENAMRDLGDRRIYEAIYAYVTMELRVQTASLDSVGTARIRNAGLPVQGDDRAGNINLPIDLPSINLMSVETTIVVPALPSLKRITGQNFGRELPRWKAWIDAQPDFPK
jgi:hypothetical protein